jgi:acyl dehydratase
MAGRYFEDWQVGDRISHAVTRTVTETDNVLITTLTHNPQPMHLDAEAAAKSEFGRPLVNSIFTFGLMIGVSVSIRCDTLGISRRSSLKRFEPPPSVLTTSTVHLSPIRDSKVLIVRQVGLLGSFIVSPFGTIHVPAAQKCAFLRVIRLWLLRVPR